MSFDKTMTEEDVVARLAVASGLFCNYLLPYLSPRVDCKLTPVATLLCQPVSMARFEPALGVGCDSMPLCQLGTVLAHPNCDPCSDAQMLRERNIVIAGAEQDM